MAFPSTTHALTNVSVALNVPTMRGAISRTCMPTYFTVEKLAVSGASSKDRTSCVTRGCVYDSSLSKPICHVKTPRAAEAAIRGVEL